MRLEGLERMAARTPPDRDRYVDFLRAFSITTVVFGHWFIALIWHRGETYGVYNAVGATSGLWLATWVLQVMPLFFFVGGFSNSRTYASLKAKGRGYREFLDARARRLLTPTAVFLGVWAIVLAILHVIDAGGDGFFRVSKLPFGPLWFLFVYMGVVLLTPVMLGAHRSAPVVTVAALAVVAGLDDLLRFRFDVEGVAWLNLAAVWLLAHQLGFFYADGSLTAAGARVHAALVVVGLSGLVLLTNIGVYPRSMVGTDVERISNMNPPTLCILFLTLWLVGAAMLFRERANAWLSKTRPWIGVIAANSMIMTVFLWHLTAYLLVILALYPLGLGRPTDSTTSWWLQRPLWIAAPAAVLTVFVVLVGRFERPRARGPRPID